MLIALTKTYGMGDVSSDARVFVMTYLKDRGLINKDIESITAEDNRAFATSSDGVLQIVHLLSANLTHATMQPTTIDRFHHEFSAILRGLFDDFKSIKLMTT